MARFPRRRRLAAASLVAVVALALGSVPGSRSGGAVAAEASGGACPVYEAPVAGVPAAANPFDPAQLDVVVTFTGPGGRTLETRAFPTRDYTRTRVGEAEQLTPDGALHWVVRARPPVPGAWSWQADIDAGGSHTTTAPVAFTCDPVPGPIGSGQPVVSDVDGRFLAHADGTPFVPRGENLAWDDAPHGTYDYDRWLDDLAAHGANWIRVWMPSWSMGIEWSDTPLGDYTNRLDRAWRLDHVIRAAAERGIVVQLVLFNHGAFSETTNSEWADNPYNAANGGPLAEPTDVFTDATARSLVQRRLRYLAARYAAFPNLIWELWNEVDLTGGAPAEVTAWHRTMVDALRADDPYGHLVTTSVSRWEDFVAGSPAWGDLWRLGGIDLVQVHAYGMGDAIPVNLVDLGGAVVGAARSFGKPVLLGEVGIDFRGPKETRAADPANKGLHEGSWIGLFGGGVGGGMNWWWDNLVAPTDGYGTILDGLGSLVAGVDPAAQHLAPGKATGSADGRPSLQVLSLVGTTQALVWVRNGDDWWHHPDASAVTGARVELRGLPAGSWSSILVDPFTGDTSEGPTLVSDGTVARFTLPQAFRAEVALRLERTGDAPAAPPPSSPPPATPVPGSASFTG